MAYSKAKLNINVDKYLFFQTIPNRKHVTQMLANPNSAIRFSKTHFYSDYQFHGDTKLNENIIQDLPPNLIMGLLEIYK